MRTPINATLDLIYRRDSRRVFATLVRLLGSFDLAEEALHDAFMAAAERWPRDGVPKNPVAWLVSAGRFKAIDGLRRNRRMVVWDEVAEQVEAIADEGAAPGEHEHLEDDRLRLIFTCCHPSLAEPAQVALTLREVCGLTTEAVAHAFLQTPGTVAQRIVRAKAKIRDARIPYQVPEADELPQRLTSVLRVIYLVFNEGYSASMGDVALKPDLSGASARTRCRRRSRRCTRRRRALRTLTGRRSSACTTRCCASSRRRWSNSIARWRSRWRRARHKARRWGWLWSMR